MHARQQRPRRALAGLGLGQAIPQDASCAPLSAGAASSHAGARTGQKPVGCGNGDPAWLDHARRGTRHHGRTSALKGTRQTGGFGPNSFFGFGSSPPPQHAMPTRRSREHSLVAAGIRRMPLRGKTGFQCPGCAARWSAAWWRAPGAARRSQERRALGNCAHNTRPGSRRGTCLAGAPAAGIDLPARPRSGGSGGRPGGTSSGGGGHFGPAQSFWGGHFAVRFDLICNAQRRVSARLPM
jgi:hypothetical protein